MASIPGFYVRVLFNSHLHFQEIYIQTMSGDDRLMITLCIWSSMNVTFLGFIILLASNSVSYISWPGRLSIG